MERGLSRAQGQETVSAQHPQRAVGRRQQLLDPVEPIDGLGRDRRETLAVEARQAILRSDPQVAVPRLVDRADAGVRQARALERRTASERHTPQ
jgi:hypothetical protein